MENLIFKYIECYLPKYGCIIIPGLGGFLLNFEPARKIGYKIQAPKYTVIFNPELKHNDGLLACIINKAEDIPYAIINPKIEDTVREIKRALTGNKKIVCGQMGILQIEGNRLVFKTNLSFINPESFGMTQVNLTPLAIISKINTTKTKNVYLKQILMGATAAVAGIVLLIAPSGSITDNKRINQQQAGFLTGLTNTLVRTTEETPIGLSDIINNDSEAENTESVKSLTLPKAETTIKEKNADIKTEKKSTPKYYLIVGGDDNKARANKLLNNFKAKGFPNAKIVESKDKYRVYVESFDNKDAADKYIKQFRLKNPKYQSAWVYAKK